MKRKENIEVVQARAERSKSEFETQSRLPLDAKRKTEFRTAIEASTERLVSIALMAEPYDSDPEAA